MASKHHWRTLFDYREDLQWVRMLGWSDADLKQVPVHEDATANENYLNLANFSRTGLGVTSRAEGGGTSANVRGSVRNLYVYSSEVPKHLYAKLSELMSRSDPADFAPGAFGEGGGQTK